MTITDWIQAISMVVLVGVTSYYAWQTRRTVQELRLQRLASKPVVIPDVDLEQRGYDSSMKLIAQSNFPVLLTNVGTAAAIELELLLITPESLTGLTGTKLPLLLPGATWRGIVSYWGELDEQGKQIFTLPPPEGLYELKVTFRSNAMQDSKLLEVVVPFELRRSGEAYYYTIEKGKLRTII